MRMRTYIYTYKARYVVAMHMGPRLQLPARGIRIGNRSGRRLDVDMHTYIIQYAMRARACLCASCPIWISPPHRYQTKLKYISILYMYTYTRKRVRWGAHQYKASLHMRPGAGPAASA